MEDKSNTKPENCLVDIRDIQIDQSLPQKERVRSFIQQVRNPYQFKVGDVTVRVSYSDCNHSLNDRFADLLSLM